MTACQGSTCSACRIHSRVAQKPGQRKQSLFDDENSGGNDIDQGARQIAYVSACIEGIEARQGHTPLQGGVEMSSLFAVGVVTAWQRVSPGQVPSDEHSLAAEVHDGTRKGLSPQGEPSNTWTTPGETLKYP